MDRAVAYLKEVLSKYRREAVATAILAVLLGASCAGWNCAKVSNVVMTPVQNVGKAAQSAYCAGCKEVCK